MKLLAVTVFLSYWSCFESLKYDSQNGILPLKETCGLQTSGEVSISGGAGPDDYPWIVFIPMQPRRPSPGSDLRCTGVLISKRYFLMSKYCLQFYMDYVYIGQYNTSHNITCGESGCRPVQKVKAVYWVGDELEIAIVRLENDVEFTEYVQPICLPFEDFPTSQPGETVYSSGWGQALPGVPGYYSQIKKNIKQVIVANEECVASGAIEKAANDRLMCTKIQNKTLVGRLCYGDEGAPIMYRTPGNQWVLQGIFAWLPNCNTPDTPPVMAGARINEEAIEFILKHIRE